jgi:phenylacetic acid degradation protein
VAIYEIDHIVPVVDPSAFVHPDAVLIGDVIVGPGVYIGPLASLRGDYGRIEIGGGSNIQDGCVLHCFPGKAVTVGVEGHIAHGAVLHGCTIERRGFVGINAIVMDGAVIGEDALVGAGAYVPAGFQLQPGWLAVGSPAIERRVLTGAERDWKHNGLAVYQALAVRSRATMRPAAALSRLDDPSRVVGAGTVAVPLNEYREVNGSMPGVVR